MRFINNDDFKHLREVTSLSLICEKGTRFDPEGIFSANIFGSEDYSCECGFLKAAWHNGEICPKCGTTIIDPKDNIYRNGRFKLNRGLKIFNPIIYMIISKHIKNFEKLINPQNKHIDINGHVIYEQDDNTKLMNFYDFSFKYKESIEELISKEDEENDEKLKVLKDFLLNNEDSVMLDSIPLLPLHLRPSQLSEKQMILEPLNRHFIAINTHIYSLNNQVDEDDYTAIDKELFEIQKNYMELTDKILSLISTKDGLARDQILSNKINFSGRAVITLKHDNDPTSVTLPRIMFTELYFPKIITQLVESMNLNYIKATEYYYMNRFNENDEHINKAIELILLTKPIVLLNRNPSLHLLSIQAFYVSGVTNDYTIKLAKTVLQSFNADFDSDFIVMIKNIKYY